MGPAPGSLGQAGAQAVGLSIMDTWEGLQFTDPVANKPGSHQNKSQGCLGLPSVLHAPSQHRCASTAWYQGLPRSILHDVFNPI